MTEMVPVVWSHVVGYFVQWYEGIGLIVIGFPSLATESACQLGAMHEPHSYTICRLQLRAFFVLVAVPTTFFALYRSAIIGNMAYLAATTTLNIDRWLSRHFHRSLLPQFTIDSPSMRSPLFVAFNSRRTLIRSTACGAVTDYNCSCRLRFDCTAQKLQTEIHE